MCQSKSSVKGRCTWCTSQALGLITQLLACVETLKPVAACLLLISSIPSRDGLPISGVRKPNTMLRAGPSACNCRVPSVGGGVKRQSQVGCPLPTASADGHDFRDRDGDEGMIRAAGQSAERGKGAMGAHWVALDEALLSRGSEGARGGLPQEDGAVLGGLLVEDLEGAWRTAQVWGFQAAVLAGRCTRCVSATERDSVPVLPLKAVFITFCIPHHDSSSALVHTSLGGRCGLPLHTAHI
jgi:hypothetical protein